MIKLNIQFRVYMNYSFMNYIKNLPFFKRYSTGSRSVSICQNNNIAKYFI